MSQKLHYDAAPRWAGSPPKHGTRSYYIIDLDELLEMPARVLTKQERDMVDDPASQTGRMLRAYTADLVLAYGNNN